MPKHKRIPIAAARRIAEDYGYDQVVIVARKVDPDGREHVTTYGVTKEHCNIAARMGDHLKYHVMKWPNPDIAKIAAELIKEDLRRHHAGVTRVGAPEFLGGTNEPID